jgi:hypothetical protein
MAVDWNVEESQAHTGRWFMSIDSVCYILALFWYHVIVTLHFVNGKPLYLRKLSWSPLVLVVCICKVCRN